MTRLDFLLLLCLVSLLAACDPKPKGGPIVDSYWQFDSYKTGNTKYILPDTFLLRLHFSNTRELVGHGPCNTFKARYEAEETTGSLQLSEFTATAKTCSSQKLEQQLFDMLRTANGFTIKDNRLVLFCPKGQLFGKPLTPVQVNELRRYIKLQQLLSMLPPLTAPPGPFYIYPTNREEDLDDYPFKGQRVSEELYEIFDEELASSWRSYGGYVYAIGSWEDYYLFRIPGRYISSDIALFRLENDRMKRIETVAWMWCDQGWCNQQHAWLVDLDRDGRFDIVNRYQFTDNKGRLVEDDIRAMRQMANGLFEDDPNLLPDPAVFQPGPVPMPAVLR